MPVNFLVLKISLYPGDTAIIALNWNLRPPPGHLWIYMATNQQPKTEVIVVPCGFDSELPKERTLLLMRS